MDFVKNELDTEKMIEQRLETGKWPELDEAQEDFESFYADCVKGGEKE